MIQSVRYVERSMLSITCQLVASAAVKIVPRWYVIIPAIVIHTCAFALIFLSRIDREDAR